MYGDYEAIGGVWRTRWQQFMTYHFARVLENTRGWLNSKLDGLDEVWDEAFQSCGDRDWCAFCVHGLALLTRHRAAINT